MLLRRLLSFSTLALLNGCSDPSAASSDASARDGGAPDVAASDTAVDAAVDAATDNGWALADSGLAGATLAPTNSCAAVVESLYATPTGLSPFAPTVRGALLG